MKLSIVNTAGNQSYAGEQLAYWLIGADLEASGFSTVKVIGLDELIDGIAADAVILIVDARVYMPMLPALHEKSASPPALPIFLLDPQQHVSASVNLQSPYQAYVTCIPTFVSLPVQFAGATLLKNQELKQRLQTAFGLLAGIAKSQSNKWGRMMFTCK